MGRQRKVSRIDEGPEQPAAVCSPQRKRPERKKTQVLPVSDSADDAVSQPGGGSKAEKAIKRKLSSPSWNTSKFRGVTKHRRSGRWEAHIWIGKGVNKQIYLGGYEKEEHAAEAYDMAAMKSKGFDTPTNFSKDKYRDLQECLDNATFEEIVTAVRRQSQGFSRGTSSYRGVSPHPSGRYEARIGIAGNKHVYLGLYNREEEAAKAYDEAVVRIKGSQASTNFTLSEYNRALTEHDLKQIEVQLPHLFHMLEVDQAIRQAHSADLPSEEELQKCVEDPKTLNGCTDPDFQKWVRCGYADEVYQQLFEALQDIGHVPHQPPGPDGGQAEPAFTAHPSSSFDQWSPVTPPRATSRAARAPSNAAATASPRVASPGAAASVAACPPPEPSAAAPPNHFMTAAASQAMMNPMGIDWQAAMAGGLGMEGLAQNPQSLQAFAAATWAARANFAHLLAMSGAAGPRLNAMGMQLPTGAMHPWNAAILQGPHAAAATSAGMQGMSGGANVRHDAGVKQGHEEGDGDMETVLEN